EERPAEVADRTVPGHWEGDLLVGHANGSALGTLVERTTRFTLLVPLTAKDAATVRQAFARELRTLPAQLRRSLTYDQGPEMREHLESTQEPFLPPLMKWQGPSLRRLRSCPPWPCRAEIFWTSCGHGL